MREKLLRISEIKISEEFAKHIPAKQKLEAAKDVDLVVPRIVVDKNNTLIDGYARYLILKKAGLREVWVSCVNPKRTKLYMKGDYFGRTIYIKIPLHMRLSGELDGLKRRKSTIGTDTGGRFTFMKFNGYVRLPAPPYYLMPRLYVVPTSETKGIINKATKSLIRKFKSVRNRENNAVKIAMK